MEFFSDDSIEFSDVYAFLFPICFYSDEVMVNHFYAARNKKACMKEDSDVSFREDALISSLVST